MNGPVAQASLVLRYARANLQSALEYRASFLGQVLAMLLNDLMWVLFWASYFDRFALPGWARADVVTLWAAVAVSAGLTAALFGNATRLAGLITRGELDFYLTLPKPPLLHALVSRMNLSGLGDLAFGLLAFILYRRPDVQQGLLFALCTLTGVTILVSFCVLVGSLAFFSGRAESLASQLYTMLINFSTYPIPIFRGPVRVLLYTLVPAAFLAAVPVQLLKQPGPLLAGELVAAAAAMAVAARAVFRLGLRRYTSGSLMVLRD